jgi:UDPglucose--hexose-1-phosphate uridylyltransferase
MSELRWNPQLGEWVITATHRQERTFLPPRDFCPLCPTRPGGVPTEIPRPHFEIAVFENRFPSLHREPPAPAVTGTSLTPVRPASGVCEVVVYTPEHDATLGTAGLERIRRLVGVWAHRTVELGARPEVDYVFVFENRGEAIGVTLDHPHGQIYAYSWLPPIPAREVARAREHRSGSRACLWCDALAEELADGRRIVAATPTWVAVVPFYARWPYEVHLLPRRHGGWLHELTADEVDGLARVLKTVLLKYDALFGFPLPYVMAVHQRPTDGGDHDAYHLHFELYPPHRTESKLKYLAGSEAGAGAFINDTLPEETAARLRGVGPGDPAAIEA